MSIERTHGRSYQRRTPEASALHRLVASKLGPLRELLVRESPYGRGLARYVDRELEEYLRCGLLTHGFARVVCRACREEHLVVSSCKRRGLCPSCTARRMFDRAAHFVDRVIPRVPVRQWVITFSRRVRYHLAAEIITRSLRTLFAWQRRHARALGERPTRGSSCGAITFVQRFNSALELSWHLHILIPEDLRARWRGPRCSAALRRARRADARRGRAIGAVGCRNRGYRIPGSGWRALLSARLDRENAG